MSTRKKPKKLYKIQSSDIHKRGVFSTAFIPKGTKILEYVGEKITKAESDRRALEREEKGRKNGSGLVYIFELNQRYDIDGNVSYNHAKYINHSCEPNAEAECIRGHIWIIATRDIEPGEELSYDYGYDMDEFLDHPCLCGSDSCIGYIVRKDLRWRVKKFLKKKEDAKKKEEAAAKPKETPQEEVVAEPEAALA
tara:strand:- start:21171 stop:21755 length:585 start_codon:yes stop_codon:yes gene_type:complete